VADAAHLQAAPATAAPADTVPGELAAIRERLAAGDGRMSALEEAVAENTAITRQIRDAMVAGRVAGQVIRVMGWMAAAGTAIWGAVYALLHHGRMPNQ